jgi:hypothetical protein
MIKNCSPCAKLFAYLKMPETYMTYCWNGKRLCNHSKYDMRLHLATVSIKQNTFRSKCSAEFKYVADITPSSTRG